MIAKDGTRDAGRLLVTGAAGFVGRHVHAAVDAGTFGVANFIAPPEAWDIRDASAVEMLVNSEKPQSVLHLAAQTFVPRSFLDPRETFEINAIGTLNLLQALRKCGFEGRFLYVSSGDVYGRVPESDLPVREDRIPEPLSPYGVSKIAAEQLCLQWQRTERLHVVIARPFNQIGPGQSAQFVLPALATQVVAIAHGNQEPIITAGDLDTTRDFTDVRDVVGAYAALIRDGVSGRIYNVGSGRERKVRDLLSLMCARMQIAPEIRLDPTRLRRAEQRRMVADCSRVNQDTRWAAKTPIEGTIDDILGNEQQA